MKRTSISYPILYLACTLLCRAVPLRSEVVKTQEVYRESFEGEPQDLWWIENKQESLVYIYHDADNQTSTILINSFADSNRRTITVENKGLTGSDTKAPLVYTKAALSASARGNQKIAYSVSKDGAMIAWIWGKILHLASLENRRLRLLAAGELRPEPVSRIVFLQENNPLIGLLFEDGKFETWGGIPLAKARSGTWFDSVWSISSQGNPLLAVSFEGHELALIRFMDLGERLDARFISVPTDFSSATLSPRGRIALGARGGVILLEADGNQLIRLGQHPIRALTFAGEEDLWAADTTGELYFSTTKGLAHKVTAEKYPILRIAAIRQRIAYSTKKEIVVMNQQTASSARLFLPQKRYQAWIIAVVVLGILTFLVALRMRPKA